jgi:hypothetical protein
MTEVSYALILPYPLDIGDDTLYVQSGKSVEESADE